MAGSALLSPIAALFSYALAAAPAPVIDVYTMGVGDYIFEHFGHAAICATDPETQQSRCYNYGTADFTTPVPLTWNFIRGRAMFWVAVADRDRMIAFYERLDRSVWRQTLPLDEAQARALAASLEKSTGESEKYYRYHHFLDNCTTRIRDHVDAAVGRRLFERTVKPNDGPSYREYAREGFAGNAGLLVAAELILGRASDAPTTAWEGMFLPEVFRRALEKELGAKPVLIYQRQKIDPPAARWLGQGLLTLIGAVLAAAIALAWKIGPRAYRAAVSIAGLSLGLFGLVLWGLAIVSAFEELRMNEVLLVLVPFDLLLGFLPENARRIYVRVRVVGLSIAVLLSAAGLLIQPLLAPISMVALVMIAVVLPVVLRERSAGVRR